MPDQPRRPRTLNDARTEAEAAFKKVTKREAEAPPPRAALPNVKEMVSLRIDQDVLDWFRERGGDYRHVALTARPLETAPDVAHWVMRHFGAWIRCFGVVPTRTDAGVPVYDRTKGEYLAWLGRGDVLVDDATENILQAQALGLKTLQATQPWNNSTMTIPALLRELSQMAGDS